MVNKIETCPQEEKIFDLSSIGLNEGINLIIGKEKYIETDSNIFHIIDLTSFNIEDQKISLTNEEGDKFFFTKEEFEIIKELIL